MQIGMQLRRIRQNRKQTLTEVGAATHLSIGYLSKIERDLTEPTLDALHKLADHYAVSVTELLQKGRFLRKHKPYFRPGFQEFITQSDIQVDEPMQNLLLQVDTQAKRPAQTKQDWLRYYYVISSVTS